ncbi:disease resistance protein RGA2-like [Magnolia sinica]|uniref:disease resistance protein RGA2-like n=1 Tax=Magnolia sinica TaxID=86752 RepID=UPI002659CB25|nr:disease resistance protein RGA2-like [Magnolia sinica]
MADWIVSIVVEKLNTILQNEVALLVGVTYKIEKLSRTFTLIQGFLEDGESRRLMDQEVEIWMERVKDVAYDVDDILEWTMEALISQVPAEGDGSSFSKQTVRSSFSLVTSFNHFVLRHKIGGRIKKTRKRLDSFSLVTSFNQFVLRHKIGGRIKETRKRLDSIAEEANQLFIKSDSGERKRECSEVRQDRNSKRETGSLGDRTAIVGREDDKNKILDLLLRNSEEMNEAPSIISIVGMDGLGKTTLSQLVYNDEKVIGHFNMRVWVSVSNYFGLQWIMKSIIRTVDTEFNGEHLGLDQLQLRLGEVLYGKRFLVVLDDVWSEDSKKWDKLRLPFNAGALGSRIIATTPSEDVGRAMGSTHIYRLPFLSYDDCWLLFSRRALEHRSVEERPELEEVGRKIVKKCGGLPLSVIAIASTMHSIRTRREWELVLESDIWNSSDVVGDILPNSLLRYQELPLALKQCFIYCSIFPKDWLLEEDTMVKLWVAQGFIRSDGSTDLEEIGSLCFKNLEYYQLLQYAGRDYDKNIFNYKMHDLGRYLAQSVAGSDYSVVKIREKALLNLNNIRHLLLIGDHDAEEMASIWPTLYKFHKLRTLLVDAKISEVPEKLFRHLKYLRVLDLSRTDMKKFPRTVPQLIHLRYLDLSSTGIEKLPAWVSDCGNLQTLRLNGCDLLHKLPRGMGKMRSLRHLELKCHLTIDSTHHLRYLPQGIGSLTSLRTLTDFIVGGDNEGCKCGELKHLNNLQGRLQIIGLENVGSSEEAMEAELDKKQHLQALSLQYDYRSGEPLGEDVKKAEDVLESLRPNANLDELDIWCYQGSKFPKWIEDRLFFNLVQVNLIYCCKCKQLPGLGKLPSLEKLTIRGMKEVRYVGDEFSGDDNNDKSDGGVSFPRLKTLIFSEMPNWEEWELRRGDGKVMRFLQELEINDCTKLKALPWNLPPSIKKLTLNISNDGMSSGGPLPVLPYLEILVISRSPDLTSLPCTWLGKLKALKRLEIHRCPRLKSLSLPEELQHLTKLQELKIAMCPLLEKRCQEGGEYRDKIAHIPYISIGLDLNDPA